jgi:hypothetical protein
MAIRLVRWLGIQQQAATVPHSLPEAAELVPCVTGLLLTVQG